MYIKQSLKFSFLFLVFKINCLTLPENLKIIFEAHDNKYLTRNGGELGLV